MPYANREAQKAYLRKYHADRYKNDPTPYIARSKNKRQRIFDFVRQQRSGPCYDCKNIYPWYVMEFDHVRPAEKTAAIPRIASRGSWRLLKEELSKCDLVCANCHRERTYRRRCECSPTAEAIVRDTIQ